MLVNFYASYCRPCEMEIPELVAMSEESVGDAGLMLVSLDSEENIQQNLGKMFARMNISFPTYHYTLSEAESFIMEMYPDWRGDIPLNLVFSKDGTLVKALGMTTPEEVTMEIHRHQSLGD